MMNYEVMGQSLLDALIILAAGIMCLKAYRIFYLDSKLLAIRFKLFALRDELGMLAVTGRVLETDRSYQYVQDLINGAIGSCERLDLRFFVIAISRKLSKETESEYESVIGDIKKRFDLQKIYGKTLVLILESFNHNSLIFSYLLTHKVWGNLEELSMARESMETAKDRLNEVKSWNPAAACA